MESKLRGRVSDRGICGGRKREKNEEDGEEELEEEVVRKRGLKVGCGAREREQE